jgi:hypothetical protein
MKLDVISDPWVKYDSTGYTVMLKTLQQARAEGIWKPCLEYLYRWGKRLYCTDRGSETDMGVALDVGVFTISSKTQESFRQQRCLTVLADSDSRLFPSRQVRNITLGENMTTIGFPSAEPMKGASLTSRKELEMVCNFPVQP